MNQPGGGPHIELSSPSRPHVPTRKQVPVLLAEDRAPVRQGLWLILPAQPHIEIIVEAGNGRKNPELAEKLHLHGAVMREPCRR